MMNAIATRFTPENNEVLGPEDMKSIRHIAKNIRNNDCILFLGAGANFAPPPAHEKHYPSQNRPPDGKGLCKILKQNLNDNPFIGEPNVGLSRVAQYFEGERGDRLELSRILIREIKEGKTPSPILKDLAQFPITHIMSTNYDKLFEMALEEVGKTSYHLGIYKRDRTQQTTNVEDSLITPDRPFLYKVHGDIDQSDSIVLTDEDYIHFILRMSDKENYNPIPRSFNDAFVKKSILFIGHRLMDYNLRLLFKTIRWGKDELLLPRNYCIDPYPDIVIRPVVTSYYKTHFVVLDAWKIMPHLFREVFQQDL